jgi:prevent-host-death family protein
MVQIDQLHWSIYIASMSSEYSAYDAKARFAEILRKVREGQSVTITYHGRPVAEVRPIPAVPETFAERLRRLEAEGVIVPPRGPRVPFRAVAKRPGALARFLKERGE